MKKLVLILLLMVGTLAAEAYDYPYLTIRTANGTETSVAVSELRLTFSNGQLVATNSTDSVTLTLSELSAMYFTETMNSISTGLQSVTEDEAVEVYTTGGVLVGRFDTMSQARATLKHGIYVIKTNERTIKTVLK